MNIDKFEWVSITKLSKNFPGTCEFAFALDRDPQKRKMRISSWNFSQLFLFICETDLSSCRWLETGGWRLLPSYSTKLPFNSFSSGWMWLYRLRDYFSLPCMNIHPKSLSHNACVSLAFRHDYHTFTHGPLSAPTGALVVMMCYYYISAAAGHFFEFSHCGLCLYQDLSMMVIEDGAPWICLDGLLPRRKIKFSASHRVWWGPASEMDLFILLLLFPFLKSFNHTKQKGASDHNSHQDSLIICIFTVSSPRAV